MSDLFGGDIPVNDKAKTYKSPYQIWKRMHNYRRATAFAKCGNCVSHMCFEYHDKYYHKCKHLGCSHGPATDIRLRNVCNLHKYAEE